VVAYAVFRVSWALALGGSFDWTIVVSLAVVIPIATIVPSVIAWQRFLDATSKVAGAQFVWPVLRTDQFATELHHHRPGIIIPQDLALVVVGRELAIWTTERKSRRILALPLDSATEISGTTVQDRMGFAAIRLVRRDQSHTDSFELIVRRKGLLTYFRADQSTTQDVLRQLETMTA
jgi:hypothetical protein